MDTTKLLATAAAAAVIVTGVTLAAASPSDQVSSSVSPRPPGPDAKEALLEAWGMTRADARPAVKAPDGKQFYVARNADVSCITDVDGGGHCGPNDALDRGLGFGGEMCRPDLPADLLRITAVVPTDVTAVRLTLPDGTTYNASPGDGAVAFDVPRDGLTTTTQLNAVLVSDSGATTVDVPLPPIAAEAVCGKG